MPNRKRQTQPIEVTGEQWDRFIAKHTAKFEPEPGPIERCAACACDMRGVDGLQLDLGWHCVQCLNNILARVEATK